MDRDGRWHAGGRLRTRRVGPRRRVSVVVFGSRDRRDEADDNDEYLDDDEHDHDNHDDRAHHDDHAPTHTRAIHVRTSRSHLCTDTHH